MSALELRPKAARQLPAAVQPEVARKWRALAAADSWARAALGVLARGVVQRAEAQQQLAAQARPQREAVPQRRRRSDTAKPRTAAPRPNQSK